MNKFLMDGIVDKSNTSSTEQKQAEQLSTDCSNHQIELHTPKTEFDLENVNDIVMQSKDEADADFKDNTDSKTAIAETVAFSFGNKSSEECNSASKSNPIGPDPSKPLRKKAKFMRMERKADKLTQSNQPNNKLLKKSPKNIEKNLESLLNEVQGKSRHKLEVNCF